MPNLPGRWPVWYPDPGAPLIPFEDNFSELSQSVADILDGYRLPISVVSATDRANKFPSPSNGDRVYRRDLGYTEVYYSAGFFVAGVAAGWQPEGGDSGNITLSLNGGWSNVGGNPAATVRVIGSMVTINGRISASTGATGSAFSLPVGARPSQTRVHAVSQGGSSGVQAVQVGADGNVFFSDLALPASDYRLASIGPWMKA